MLFTVNVLILKKYDGTARRSGGVRASSRGVGVCAAVFPLGSFIRGVKKRLMRIRGVIPTKSSTRSFRPAAGAVIGVTRKSTFVCLKAKVRKFTSTIVGTIGGRSATVMGTSRKVPLVNTSRSSRSTRRRRRGGRRRTKRRKSSISPRI